MNVWFGRMLVPTERGELNGSFYHAVFDGFRTPFNESDFSGGFGAGGAGLYGRDNGVTFFGKIHPGGTHLQYVGGIFHGTESTATAGPNQRNSLKYAGRITWNLLNEEKNPVLYRRHLLWDSRRYSRPRSRWRESTPALVHWRTEPTAGILPPTSCLKKYWGAPVWSRSTLS